MTLYDNQALCKIRYSWVTPEKRIIPEQVSVCNFVWSTLFSLIIVWPIFIICELVGWVVRIVGAPIALILFGYRPAGSEWIMFYKMQDGENLLPFAKIKNWLKFDDLHIMPIVPLAVLFILYGIFYIVLWDWTIRGFFIEMLYPDPIGRIVVWVVVGSIISAILYFATRNHGFWRLTREYWKAHKEKVCPMIQIKRI